MAWDAWDRSLGIDVMSAVAFAWFAAAVASPAVVVALARTMAERDRSEALHWDAMEGVRALNELSARPDRDLDESLLNVLEIGCSRFDLDVGIVSRVSGKRYEVIALRAPENFPITRGSSFPLDDTYCRLAMSSERPVAIDRTVADQVQRDVDDIVRRRPPVQRRVVG